MSNMTVKRPAGEHFFAGYVQPNGTVEAHAFASSADRIAFIGKMGNSAVAITKKEARDRLSAGGIGYGCYLGSDSPAEDKIRREQVDGEGLLNADNQLARSARL